MHINSPTSKLPTFLLLLCILCMVSVAVSVCAPARKRHSYHKSTSPRKKVAQVTKTPATKSASEIVPPHFTPAPTSTPFPSDTREHPELWPQLPLSPNTNFVAPPIALAPAHDPLVYVTSNPVFKGRVFYIPFIGHEPYLAFRGVNEQGEIRTPDTDTNSSSVFYPYQPGQGLSHPQFCPGGEEVSFIEGIVYRYQISRHINWNVRGRSLDGYGVVDGYASATSPDLKYTAFAEEPGYGPEAELEIFKHGPEERAILHVDKDEFTVPDFSYSVANFVWTPQNTLLYVKFPLNKRLSLRESGVYRTPYHPSIYESQWNDTKKLTTKTQVLKKQFIEDAYAPQPSPDGQWIAYFGWPPVKNKTSRKLVNPSLFLFNRQNSQKYILRSKVPDSVTWSKNSKQLIVMDISSKSDPAVFRRFTATLSKIDAAQAIASSASNAVPRLSPVATLEAVEVIPRFSGVFRLRGISNDDKWIFVDKVKTKLALDGKPSNHYDTNETMVAVNLADGHSEDVFRLDIRQNSVDGWDWYDDSPSPLKASGQ